MMELEAERARERAPKENPFKFDDPRAQRFSDLWFSQRRTATIEQKDQVGFAYIRDVLQLEEEVAARFATNDWGAWAEVGLKQSGIPPVDTTNFWARVREIFPDTYGDEDIKFLTQKGRIMAVSHLLEQLEVQLAEESPVLHALAVNAHAYK